MTLGPDTYETIKAMLDSSDIEDVAVALTIIENSDLEANLIYVLLLMREDNNSMVAWNEHAPKTTKLIRSVLKTSVLLVTFDAILHVMERYNSSEKEYSFFMDRYAKMLEEKITKMSNDETGKKFEITIKIKQK